MRISVWKTGHEIADTVADAIKEGMPDAEMFTTGSGVQSSSDVHIGYGILRGMADVFRMANNQEGSRSWFNVDRGYFHPSHYDGYYRVSLNGTQQTNLHGIDPDYGRLAALNPIIKPWRGFDHSKPVLVCPPTPAVCQFFGYEPHHFIPIGDAKYVMRNKGDPNPINFDDYNYVLTFNSSVGWQALMAGIPCVSDETHSIVGSFFKEYHIKEKLSENSSLAMYKGRMRLFGCMAALQLTLNEMREGKLWPLMKKLMSGSAMIAEKPLGHTSPPIPSSSVQMPM